MRHSPTLLLFFTALFGAFLGFFVVTPSSFLLTGSVSSGLFALFLSKKIFRVIFAFLFCLLLTSFLSQRHLSNYQRTAAQIPAGKNIFEGHVHDIIQTLEKGVRATFKVTGTIEAGLRHEKPITLTLFLRGQAAALPFSEGDKIRVLGKAKKLSHALYPGDFDLFWFGVARKIHGSISIQKSLDVALLEKADRKEFFSSLREFLRVKLLTLLTPRETGVVLALVIGDTYLFDSVQKSIYQNLGAGHLLAVSGLQISLLAAIFFGLFKLIFSLIPFTGRRSWAGRLAAWTTLFFIWSFTFLCGAPPSAVRAAFMASVILCSIGLARSTHTLDAFGLAGLSTVLFWPASAIDPSFLLSYGAIFGLLTASEVKKNALSDEIQEDSVLKPAWDKLSTLAYASFAAGLMTLPISAYLFGQIAPFGILVNILLVPIAVFLQTPAIFLGLFGALLNNANIASIGASAAGLLEALCDLLSHSFGHLFFLQTPSPFSTVLFSVVSFSLIIVFHMKQKLAVLGLSAFLFTSAILIDAEWETGIRVTVLPVGQGDSTVFEFPNGKVMIVDGGGGFNEDYDPGKTIVIPFLKRRGIRHIDVAVLSHPDGDHLLGLLSILESVPTKELWYRPSAKHSRLLSKLLVTAKRNNVDLVSSFDLKPLVRFGESEVHILNSGLNKRFKGTNDNSLILRITHKKSSALWPGDIEAKAEQELVLADEINSSVVKAPHHGSKSSSTIKFVNKTGANHVIFCTKENNMWDFPHSQIVKRWQNAGAKTWDTGTQGEITIWLTGKETIVKAFRRGKNDERQT